MIEVGSHLVSPSVCSARRSRPSANYLLARMPSRRWIAAATNGNAFFNQQSRKAIERLGFKASRAFSAQAHGRHADGTLARHVLLSIIQTEWPQLCVRTGSTPSISRSRTQKTMARSDNRRERNDNGRKTERQGGAGHRGRAGHRPRHRGGLRRRGRESDRDRSRRQASSRASRPRRKHRSMSARPRRSMRWPSRSKRNSAGSTSSSIARASCTTAPCSNAPSRTGTSPSTST